MRKKIFISILLIITVLVVWQFRLISYGISQGVGQMSIVWNAKDNSEFLNDPSFPDSLKEKIRLVEEIRKFAFDSLGINYSENYTTTYDQQGKPVLLVLTASEPFELKPKKWSFPIIGTFSYKGFFDFEKGKEEENTLIGQGFDTSLDEVSGWSTLGWFKDPILSNMLYRNPGSLANLIIHELTHGTLYIKDSIEYNENLASFVGDKGALLFLEFKYGKNSNEYNEYLTDQENYKSYSALVLKLGERLDSMYQSSKFQNLSKKEKERRKKEVFKSIRQELLGHPVFEKRKAKNRRFNKEFEKINNTYFLDFKRYREKQDNFQEEFSGKFNSDFRSYFEYLKEKYPSL